MYTHPSFAKAIVKGFDPSTHTPLSLSRSLALSFFFHTANGEGGPLSPRERSLVSRLYGESVRKLAGRRVSSGM